MSEKPIPSAADELDALLNDQPSAGQALDPAEAAFAEQVRDLAGTVPPADSQFYKSLEQKLLAKAERRRARRVPVWVPVLASLAGTAVLLALVLLSGPMVQRLLGQPAATVTTQVISGPAAHTPTAGSLAPATSTPAPTVQPTPTQGKGWTLATALPEGPQSVPQYLQVAKGEPLTPQSAQAMAERLGVKGSAYQATGVGGNPMYYVSDGISWVLFFGSTNLEFNYTANSAFPAGNEKGNNLPFDQEAKIAEDWLKARGLLDFPYQLAPMPTDSSGVMVIQSLEGGEMYLSNAYDPPINVRINPQGQVTGVIYRSVRTETSGSLTLRPAAEVWTALQKGQLGKKVFYQTLDFSGQRSLKQWFHSYQDGQQVDLYGYALVLQAVQPGQLPYVEVAGVPLKDNGDIIGQISMRKYLHVWGVYHIDDQNRGWLTPQGWELSPLEETGQTGQITRESGAARLKTETGETYTLTDLPADVPEGVKVSVNGVLRKTDEFLWNVVFTEPGPDNNQTSGSLYFPTEADAPMPTPQPPVTGYQPGDKIEGLQGYLSTMLYQETDGSQTLERRLGAGEWMALLKGPGAEGIEKYDRLPVKVWGTYQQKGADITITVDRYEPVWPDVKIEPWFGQVTEQTLEGKNVFILTDDSGKQWVLDSTTQGMAMSLANFGWDSGQKIIVNGYPSPEGKTFGGLPLMIDQGMGINNKGLTKETYPATQGTPVPILRQSAEPGLPETAIVDKVELVYLAYENHGWPPPSEPVKMQPLWRFSGHLPDGRAFEALVPAE